MTRDYVCGMDVEESTSTSTIEYADDVYFFCSEQCKLKFEADPERYVSRHESSAS
jgi:Cu+-exporting ATPase